MYIIKYYVLNKHHDKLNYLIYKIDLRLLVALNVSHFLWKCVTLMGNFC